MATDEQVKVTTVEEIVAAEERFWALWDKTRGMKGVDGFNYLTKLTARMATHLCCSTIGDAYNGVAQENRNLAFAISNLLDTLNALNTRSNEEG